MHEEVSVVYVNHCLGRYIKPTFFTGFIALAVTFSNTALKYVTTLELKVSIYRCILFK